MGLNLTWN